MSLRPNGAARGLEMNLEDRDLQWARAAQQSQQMLAGLEGPFWSSFPSERGYSSMFERERLVEGVQPRPLRRGLMEAFVNTCQRWKLSDHSQAVLLGYGANPALAAEFLSGRNLNLPQDARDRVGYIVGISAGLGALFNEVVQAEVAWLNRPQADLRDQSPLAFMLQGQMANVMMVSALVAQEQGL